MISVTAMEDVEALAAEGVKLPPREIVRLNALGLKVERRPDGADLFALPRVAFLGDLVLREPTVGHLVYIDEADELVNLADTMTSIAFFAFVLSRDVDDLPPLTRFDLRWRVRGFIRKELRRFTIEQIRVAVEFALYGNDAADGERPASGGESSEEAQNAARASVGVGLMREAQSLRLGISVADMKSATVNGLRAVVDRAYELKGVEVAKRAKHTATGEYFRTLEELKAKYSHV